MSNQNYRSNNNKSYKSREKNSGHSSSKRSNSKDCRNDKPERKPWEYDETLKYIDQIRVSSDGRAIISLKKNTPPPVAICGAAPEASKHRKESAIATATMRNKLAAKVSDIPGAGKSLRIAIGMGRFNFNKFVSEVTVKAPELVNSGKTRNKLMEVLNNAAAESLKNKCVRPSMSDITPYIGKANDAPYFQADVFVNYFEKKYPEITQKNKHA